MEGSDGNITPGLIAGSVVVLEDAGWIPVAPGRIAVSEVSSDIFEESEMAKGVEIAEAAMVVAEIDAAAADISLARAD